MTLRAPALVLALSLSLGFTAIAVAQIGPNDTGAGVQRGMQELNNSGEVGDVTLFRRGEATLVVIHITSEPAGRSQPAHVHRGKDCNDIDPKPAFGLAPVINGRSRTIVHYPIDKLLSGNYVVNVHASDSQLTRYVSCGQLY